MKISQIFFKTNKLSKTYESINATLLIKAGYIDQLAAGIYTLLPLGLKVLKKIENIIREEMNKIGAIEILMPLLHPKSNWETTNRWQTVEVLFKTTSQYGQDYGLAPTHEEIITPLVKKFLKSEKDLPLAIYHISTKFRDEPRPKSGILRGREFGMKDLYSFHLNKEDLEKYYKKVIDAYLKIFNRCGLTDIKITEASGGSFTKKYSHEFNVITPAGEVDLIYCSKCTFAQNQEISQLKENDQCPKCKNKLKNDKAIEVGNIFDLGTRFSEDFDLCINDKSGKKIFLTMGCYGIGTTRLIGAIVEIYHDANGIIWSESISPFKFHLIGLDLNDNEVYKKANKLYERLINNNIEVLFDDRQDVSPGEKFKDADLIGIPNRLLISKKTGDKIEYKHRQKKQTQLLTFQDILKI